MALNLLTVEEMVYVTQPLVDPENPTRAALLGVPGMAVVMPHIEDAYEGLLVAMDKGRVQSLAEIDLALEAADTKHDGLARAVYYALETHAHLARAYGEEQTAEALALVQNDLFPDQLRVVDLSYRDEAGQARQLARNINANHEQWLAGIPMPGGSLLDTLQAWLAAGEELGELERQRNSVDVPGRRLRVNRARSRWVRAIRAVRTIVELTEPDEPLVEEALGRITAAEMAANPRAFPARAADGTSLGPDGRPATESDTSSHRTIG